MAQISAGLLVYRRPRGRLEFLLAHPGGPFWRGKDRAAWSVPKGLAEPGEDLWAAARREFQEEIGLTPSGPAVGLAPFRLPGGKQLHCWLVEADLDLSDIRSNSFEMEWPRGSGRRASWPEVDQAAYFDPSTAGWKIHRGQRPLIEAAAAQLGWRPPADGDYDVGDKD